VGRNVSEIISETLPISLELGMYSLILSFLFGIPIGIYAAARHNSWLDHTLMIVSISFVSLPSFLVAPLLILLFCFGLHWFEPALWNGPASYTLPVIVLATRSMAIVARLTRSSALEVIGSDYIRTARSKGLSSQQILFKHVLKNSLIPVLTFSGPLAAEILSGTFVVEQIFAIPGLGKHMILSVSNRDYPLILATTLLFAVMLVIANLIVDLLYVYFDPRIKLS
jgi:oligopeptide transport system permease protein